MNSNSQENWEIFFQKKNQINHPLWPNEAIIKVIFGDYLKNKIILKNKGRILDVGCGFANNLLPFLYRGWEGAGTEITPKIVEQIVEDLQSRGIDADIRTGNNRDLPFDDDSFDLLLSLGVLHYENCQEDIDQALNEYKRVLKDDGAIIIYTAGPEHDIVTSSKQIKNNIYRIQNYDFRDGEEYFYFDSTKYLEYFMRRHFGDVEVGQVTEKLMTKTVDFLVAVCRDPL